MSDQRKSHDSDERLAALALDHFQVYDFHRVDLGDGHLHFQALLLREA